MQQFFKVTVYAVNSNRHPPSLFGEHCEILQTEHMANFEKNVEEMLGTTREVAAVAGRDGEEATTGDETMATADDETAATGGVMFRIEIVEGLFASYMGSNVRAGRPVVNSPAPRLKGQNDHNLQPIPGTNSKGKELIRDCVVCSNTPLAGSSKGARHRSSYECSECKKTL